MKIETVTASEKKRDSFIVIFDDGATLMVTAAQIADFGLYSGRELSDGEYAELCEGIELSTSKSRALRILGSRTLSARELENRLTRRGDSPQTAQMTVQWLESIGAVNDAEYAASIVRHYCSKSYGISRIKDELYKRGIPRELWDDVLEGLEGTEDAALAFLHKKLAGSCDKADVRRARDALYRRGFCRDEISNAVNKYMEDCDLENCGDAEEYCP